MIYVFLAQGFEEIEALATVDVLRRAGLPVTTVGIGGDTVMGAHQIAVKADISETMLHIEDATAVVLPGGLPGTTNLDASKTVESALQYAAQQHLIIAAICAAPTVLSHKNLLKGKKVTCYPGYDKEFPDALLTDAAVVRDDNIITGKGAGVAIDFGLEIVEAFGSKEQANTLKEAMQCQ